MKPFLPRTNDENPGRLPMPSQESNMNTPERGGGLAQRVVIKPSVYSPEQQEHGQPVPRMIVYEAITSARCEP